VGSGKRWFTKVAMGCSNKEERASKRRIYIIMFGKLNAIVIEVGKLMNIRV
jgi:hypothetical protein